MLAFLASLTISVAYSRIKKSLPTSTSPNFVEHFIEVNEVLALAKRLPYITNDLPLAASLLALRSKKTRMATVLSRFSALPKPKP